VPSEEEEEEKEEEKEEAEEEKRDLVGNDVAIGTVTSKHCRGNEPVGHQWMKEDRRGGGKRDT